jgi:hypothetical protein
LALEIEPEPTDPGWKPYHLSVEQFRTMIRAGIFSDGACLELLGGILVAKAVRSDPHDFVVGAIGDEIRRFLPAGWFVREEKPIAIGKRSQPETTYLTDRADRWRIYATARIPAYWIVHMGERRVEIYRDPIGRAQTATYRLSETFGSEDHVPLILDGLEVGRIAVKEFLL